MENSVTLRPEGRRIFIKGTITQEAIEPIQEAMTANSIFCLDFSEVAILSCNEGVFHGKPPKIVPRNTVGCGDSMVAGFVAGCLQKGDYAHALRLGAACGNATAFSEALAQRADIDRIYEIL